MVNPTRELLRSLAAHDERCLHAVLHPGPPARGGRRDGVLALSRETRALVELAALLAADAATPSLRWAVDRAAATGAGDDKLVQVLLASASAAGSACTAASAARLALALDLDLTV